MRFNIEHLLTGFAKRSITQYSTELLKLQSITPSRQVPRYFFRASGADSAVGIQGIPHFEARYRLQTGEKQMDFIDKSKCEERDRQDKMKIGSFMFASAVVFFI